MNDKHKTPDRINISKKSKNIINKIEEEKFLNLDSTNTSRSLLFSFAMAIGLETIPTKLENVHSGGLILDASIDSKTKSLMYSYIISESKNKVTLDDVSDKEYVYKSVQELANTGFQVIEDYMNKNENDVIWKMLKELDVQYYENVENGSSIYDKENFESPIAAENNE